MNRELLEKPFAPDQIKQREGNFGRMLDYIEGHTIIQRLNDAFDAEWSFRIISHEIVKEVDEVLVLGELKAFDIVKSQFGSSKIKKARETGEIISLADDLKAAATDALKKTATLLGIGLHLYDVKTDTDRPDERRTVQSRGVNVNFERVDGHGNVYKPKFEAKTATSPDPGNGNGTENKRRQLSLKQFGYIRSLGRKNYGFSLSDLSERTIKIFGVEVHALSTAEASRFIEMLHSGEVRSIAV